MQNAAHNNPERVVLLTGAGSGIGLAIAKKLYAGSYRVVATTRQRSLHRLAEEGLHESERFLCRPLDVSKPAEQSAVVDEICRRWGAVDVLINNAGITIRSVMEDIQLEEDVAQMATNYYGPMQLARLVLPAMRQQRSGHIINISSVGGMMAMPTMGPYSASKFALEGGSEAMWYELRPWGIKVTLFQPGFVHSESFRKARLTEQCRNAMEDDCSPYHRYYKYMLPFIEKMMLRSPTTPEDIADRVLKVLRMKNPRLRVPATLDAWVFYYLRKFMPRRLYHEVLYRGLPGIAKWVDPA